MLATIAPPTVNEMLLRLAAANRATAERRKNAETRLWVLFAMPFVFSFAIVLKALVAMAGGAAFHSYNGASGLLLLLPIGIAERTCTLAPMLGNEPESIAVFLGGAIMLTLGTSYGCAINQVCDYSSVVATVLVVCFVYELREYARALHDLEADAINYPVVVVLAVMAFGSGPTQQCAHVDGVNERCSQRTIKGAPTCAAHA